ncbi:MAG TPA: hypothetical protein VFF63_02790 [Candidatus Babeliales bacterium]|nr:hypothetical protein [Candidatus Babeliales bacterium]
MNKASISRRAALAICAAVLFPGCGGNAGTEPPTLAPGTAEAAPRLLRASLAVRPPVLVRRDLRKSWISPDVKNAPRLLFASDAGTDEVDIFTLPDLNLKGTITGFSEPQGECSNNNGYIWVANTGTEQLLEYSRTGLLLNTINDAYGYPVGCAVNPTNNDVAVFNIFDISGQGGAYVYSCPSCTPTVLTIPGFYYYYFGGYDPAGDLFVSGRNASGDFALGEVPNGSTSGYVITITGGTIYFPGFIQWYKPGDYIVSADQLCGDTESSCVYWIKISGKNGTIIGQTYLENPEGGQICDLVQGVLNPVGEKNLVGGDYDYCSSGPSSENRWLYPAGGIPTNSVEDGLVTPIGTAISVK